MSYVSVAISVGSALQSVNSGKYAKGQSELQASQDEYQAKIERDNALRTAALIRKSGARTASSANAAYAGAGVQVGQGSAQDTERYIDEGSEKDAYQALLEGNRRARGMETDAQMSRINGGLQESAGYVNAVGNILQGAGSGVRNSRWRTQQNMAPVSDAYPVPVGRIG